MYREKIGLLIAIFKFHLQLILLQTVSINSHLKQLGLIWCSFLFFAKKFTY